MDIHWNSWIENQWLNIIISNNWDDLDKIIQGLTNHEIKKSFRDLRSKWDQYYQESNAEWDYEMLYKAKDLLRTFLIKEWIPFIFEKDRYKLVDVDMYTDPNGRVIGPVTEYPNMPQNTWRIRVKQLIEATKASHLRLV